MERILNFLSLTTLIISNDLDQYVLGEFKGSRLAKVLAYRVILVISVLRFTVSALINDPMVSALMADATHMFGNPKLICIFISTLSMSFFAITIVSAKQEFAHHFSVLDFFSAYRRKRAPQLNQTNNRRLALRINLMAKLFFYHNFWFLISFTHIVITTMTFLTYWDYQDVLLSSCLILWSVLLILCIHSTIGYRCRRCSTVLILCPLSDLQIQ